MSDERRTEREPENSHNTAAALIVAAARQSGLLREVAEVLCFIDRTESLTATVSTSTFTPTPSWRHTSNDRAR